MKLPCRFRNRFYSCVSPAPNHVFFFGFKIGLRFSFQSRFGFWLEIFYRQNYRQNYRSYYRPPYCPYCRPYRQFIGRRIGCVFITESVQVFTVLVGSFYQTYYRLLAICIMINILIRCESDNHNCHGLLRSVDLQHMFNSLQAWIQNVCLTLKSKQL